MTNLYFIWLGGLLMFAGNVRYVKQECSIAAYLIYK